MTSENRDEKKVPGLLEMLAQVPDTARSGAAGTRLCSSWRSRRVALAGAKTYREIGDQAADLPQDVLARLGGRIHPLKRAIIAPQREADPHPHPGHRCRGAWTRSSAGWLRALAQAGKLEPLLTAIAIDGKWLRGIADGTEKLFAAMLQEEKVIIGHHRIPGHQRDHPGQRAAGRHRPGELRRDRRRRPRPARPAEYIAGKKEDGGRDAAYAVTVKGNQPALQRDIHDKITKDRGAEPDYADLDCSHGRIILRSIWVTDAAGIDFPRADQVYRIPRDAYDITGTYLSKEIVHGIASLDARRAPPRSSARSPGASGALNRCTGCVTPPGGKTRTPATPGTPQVMASLRNTRSACCISPGSPRSSGPSRQSAVTGTASSTTCRYEIRITSSPPTTLPIPCQ